MENDHPKLTIDKEFSRLLPPLDASEYSTLEKICLRDGILDPIFIWRGKIADGHNRYAIARKHHLPFRTRELNLPDRSSVKRWILEYQLARRSISTYDKIVLALQFEESYQEKAKINQSLSRGRSKKGRTTVVQPFSSVDVLEELGKVAGTGRTSVSNVKFILTYADSETQQKCSEGRLPIHTAYLIAKTQKRQDRKERSESPAESYTNPKGQYENTIICGDALKILKQLPDEHVTCFIFSPPYNNGTNYSFGVKQDSRPYTKYMEWMGKIVTECSRVLRDGGRLIINVDSVGVRLDDTDYTEGTKYTIYPDLMNTVREMDCGFIFRDEICWYKRQHGGRISAWGSYLSASSPNIRRNHEYVVVWQKGKGRMECITGQKSDLTKEDWNKSIYSVWEIGPECERYKEHPSPFPEELVKRLIRLYSFPQDLICDPFNGIGTTTACAAALGRRWLGIDLNPKYCKRAVGRIGKSGSE
jgi:DNA modification methylase